MSPSEGSESGAGWGLLQAVRRFAHVTVLHASSDAEELARYQTEHPSSDVRFVHVPVARFPNPDHRNKVFRFIAYIRWIPRARRAALGLIAAERFDVIHHATWSVYWLPSAARGLALPVVWGPVGGAVVTPAQIVAALTMNTPTPAGKSVVTPAAVDAILSMLTPTVAGKALVVPAEIVLAAVLNTPVPAIPTTVTPAEIAALFAVNAPTLVGGAVVVPGVIGVIIAVPTPTLLNTDAGAPVTVFIGIYGVGHVLESGN